MIDLRGLYCPLPVLKAHKYLAEIKSATKTTLLASDPLTEIDIPHMCQENGHHLLEIQHKEDGTLIFIIETATTFPEQKIKK